MVTSGERNKGNKPVRLHRFQVEVSLHTWVILSLINGYKLERNKPVRLHRFQVEVSLHTWVILSLINGYKWGEEQAGQTTQIQGKSTHVGYPFSDK